MSPGREVAVVYHYFEKNETYRDNFIFFLSRAWRPDLDMFVVIAGDYSVALPQRDNIRYVFTHDSGHDFGSYAQLTETGALDHYARLVFVNCSVRGPFLPHYVDADWTRPFLSLLKDDVHLCGSTINILHDTRPYHVLYRERHPDDPEPFSHVQSSAHAMTGECFGFLRERRLYAAAAGYDKDEAIVDCELAMSQLVRKRGWNIACLLPPYNAIDYRYPHSEINPTTTTGHPQARGAYFGLTPHPFELVFVKTEWPLLDAAARSFHSLMAMDHHPIPSLDWDEARSLRARLIESLGEPFAALHSLDRSQAPAAESAPPALRRSQTTGPRPHCILVLGMHRSGTSALAGAMALLGAAPPANPMAPHASNPKGFFESVLVRDFNDALLASAGSSWKDWRPISPDWFASSHAKALHEQAGSVLDREFGAAPLFVLKDPRICRLLPFWRTVLEQRGICVSALHTHRHPREVAGSLAERYRLDPSLTHLVWLRHLLDAEAASRGLARCFTSYNRLLAAPHAVARQISHAFNLPLLVETAAEQVDGFLSKQLRNHDASGSSQGRGLAPWYEETLAIFERWAMAGETAAECARLDQIRREFDRSVLAFAATLKGGHAVPERR